MFVSDGIFRPGVGSEDTEQESGAVEIDLGSVECTAVHRARNKEVIYDMNDLQGTSEVSKEI